MSPIVRPALVMTLGLTVLAGLAYPLLVTGLAQGLSPATANGSLIRDADGRIRGSLLIGQRFAAAAYLHPRPSAAGERGYDAANSSGSNLGPLDPRLARRVAADASRLSREAPGVEIPPDALTTSGSGLDPDVSPEYARLQAQRIATSRHVAADLVLRAIQIGYEGPALGFIGQPRVNVLRVNLALDRLAPQDPSRHE